MKTALRPCIWRRRLARPLPWWRSCCWRERMRRTQKARSLGISDDSPLKGTDAYWWLYEGRNDPVILRRTGSGRSRNEPGGSRQGLKLPVFLANHDDCVGAVVGESKGDRFRPAQACGVKQGDSGVVPHSGPLWVPEVQRSHPKADGRLRLVCGSRRPAPSEASPAQACGVKQGDSGVVPHSGPLWVPEVQRSHPKADGRLRLVCGSRRPAPSEASPPPTATPLRPGTWRRHDPRRRVELRAQFGALTLAGWMRQAMRCATKSRSRKSRRETCRRSRNWFSSTSSPFPA